MSKRRRSNCDDCAHYEQGDRHPEDGKCNFALPEKLPFWLRGQNSIYGKSLEKNCIAYSRAGGGQQVTMELSEALEISEEACRNWSLKEDDEYSQASVVVSKFIDSGAASTIEQLQADKAELVKAGNALSSQWLMCLDLGNGESMDLGEFDIHVNKFKELLGKHTGGKG